MDLEPYCSMSDASEDFVSSRVALIIIYVTLRSCVNIRQSLVKQVLIKYGVLKTWLIWGKELLGAWKNCW